MRIDIVDLIPQIDTNLGGAFVGGTMNVQTVKPPYDALRFECTVTGEEMTGLMSGEIDKVEFAKEKIKGHLELDVEKVDAFDIESYRRELAEKDKEIKDLTDTITDLALMFSGGLDLGGAENYGSN